MSTESQLTTTEDRIAARVNPAITKDIRLRPTGAIAYNNADEMMEVAKLMAISQVAVPKHCRANPGVCLAIVIRASEWEMSPFAVAEKTYVVNDRVSFEAQLVNAVILRRAPIKGRFKISYSGEGMKRKCKVTATLADGDTVDYESPEISTIPVKNSPLWKGDPDQQLFYYSSRAMCRRHFPDVLLGVYTPDEAAMLQDEEPAKTAIGRIEKVERPPLALQQEPEPEPAATSEPKPTIGRVVEPQSTTAASPEATAEPAQDTAVRLREDILNQAKKLDVGEKVLVKVLIAERLMEPSEKFVDLTEKKLSLIIDAWDETIVPKLTGAQ